jgi:8-amino-7-oxononanoate synthase
MDVFEKCSRIFAQTEDLRKSGYYFFFRKLESPQDAEVVVHGKRVIMIGSNNYLGLTNHPRVKEAAIKAQDFSTGI